MVCRLLPEAVNRIPYAGTTRVRFGGFNLSPAGFISPDTPSEHNRIIRFDSGLVSFALPE